MNKLWLIIKREYLTRVTKKSFILVTILAPLGIGLIMFVAGYLASSSAQATKNIVVIDKSNVIDLDHMESSYLTFVLSDESIGDMKLKYDKEGYDPLLFVPPFPDLNSKNHQIEYYSKEKLSLPTIESIERRVEKAFEEYKLDNSEVDRQALENLEINIGLENGLLNETDDSIKGDKSSKISSMIATGLSYIMGFLMYMVIFIFGGMVMRSVMEEKINRIVEVMISSVKPFQLMLGKIVGVGLVGLTQLSIWIILIPIIMTVVTMTMGPEMAGGSTEMAQATEMVNDLSQESDDFSIAKLIQEVKNQNWLLILPSFIIYFLGGYFIYSSLFAAVGSAIGDDLGEGQQLMFPIVIPVIIALVMVPAVFSNPDGPLAVFGSMFPLFSPILMPARLPFEPPIWQVLLSILILIGSVIFMIWLAGRIYRIGIFMYGKKVSFKEIAKWIFYK
jgi:ABC-2 type transport system permease protein